MHVRFPMRRRILSARVMRGLRFIRFMRTGSLRSRTQNIRWNSFCATRSWQNGMRAERYFCFDFPWTIITGISLWMTASARRNGGLRVCSTRSIRRRMIFARSIKKIREPTRCCSPQISAHCCRWRSAR